MSYGGGPMFGSGGFFGGGGYGPRGPYGAWPSCGCSSFLMIAAGLLLVFGGCMRQFGM
jgi:hypothetical protein